MKLNKQILTKLVKEEKAKLLQGTHTYGTGDIVKDINPDCPHHGAEGKVTKVGKGTITFIVTNNGKNYKEGDELEKTEDQMVKLTTEGKLSEGYDVIGYSKRLEKIYDEYGMVVGNLKTDLKNNGYKKESIELERAFGKFVYKFYMQTRNILRRTNEVKEGKLTEGIKRWKIYVKGQSKPFVVGADSSSKAKQLAHMMIKNSSIKIDKIVQEIVNEKHTVWRKTPHTGKIKKGMYVWFVDNRGTQRIKVKHIMKAKDGKDLYITNKGTFEEKDVAGY